MPKYRILYEDVNGLETTLAESNWLVVAAVQMAKASLTLPDAPRLELRMGGMSIVKMTSREVDR